VKRLTVTLLAISVFTPTVFAQTVEIIRGTKRDYQSFAQSAEQVEQQKVFSAWREKIEGAERDYKNKHGRYGDLTALRKARLFRSLVFESGSWFGASRKATANFVPKNMLIQVTLSEDSQQFNIAIIEQPYVMERVLGPQYRDFEDSPEGPIISVAR